MRTIVGLDIDHSAVKIRALYGGGSKVLFSPSVVTKAVRISDAVAEREAQADIVRFAGNDCFIGKATILQCSANAYSGLSADWITRIEHSVLYRGAIKKLAVAGVPDLDGAPVVLGLLAANFRQQKKSQGSTLASLANVELVVEPQPAGPYNVLAFTENGEEEPERTVVAGSWAAVDVGHYTTDFMLMQKGRWIEPGVGSCDGMHLAVSQLQQEVPDSQDIRIAAIEAEEVLPKQTIVGFGQEVGLAEEVYRARLALVNQVLDRAAALPGENACILIGVSIASGGAPPVCEPLRECGKHVIMLPNPHYSVTEGFTGFGRVLDSVRIMRQKGATK